MSNTDGITGLTNFLITGTPAPAVPGASAPVPDYKEKVDFLSMIGIGDSTVLTQKGKKKKTEHHDKTDIAGLEDAEEGMHEVNGKKVFVQDDGTTSVPKGGAAPKKVIEKIKPEAKDEEEVKKSFEVLEVKELEDGYVLVGLKMRL